MSMPAAIEDSHVFTYPRGWFMVARADEVLADKPLPLKFFGRMLVAFWTADGSPAVLDGTCPHMGAALAVGGTVDGNGVRCPFHNWRFGPDGRCNDIPYTKVIPPKARVNAYPARELKGLVFAYMGPPEATPAFPYLDSLELPGHDLVPYSIHSPCNWLQETENAIDPFHSVFLHGRVNGPQFPGLEHFVELPVCVYHRRDAGIVYSHARRTGDLVTLRFHDYLMPNLAQNGGMFQKMSQPRVFGRTSLTKWVVPIDDTNSRKFGWRHFNDADEVLRRRDAWRAVPTTRASLHW